MSKFSNHGHAGEAGSTGKLKWRNWSGLVRSTPEQIVYPESVEQVAAVINECSKSGKSVRVVGSGHSFTPLVQTDRVLLSLDRMQGVRYVDDHERIATVWAGTRLKRLGEELFLHGYAQENLGDINEQSIGGAIGTGTHGTGKAFGSLSTQVVGLTIVTGSGEVVECSETENREWFKAAQVSLGMLGVIVEVKLRVIPAQTMHFSSKRMKLDDCLNGLELLAAENRHFEYYWFPNTDVAQVKLMNATEASASQNSLWNHFNKLVIENGVFWLLSESCRLFPSLSQSVSRISAKFVPVFEEVGYGHQLFATPRLVKFNEMEYNVPASCMKAVLEEMQACVKERQFAVHFPVECRYVKGDDIWLSPAYGRDSAYIAVHMYKGMPYEEYFAAMESIFRKYGGRPHWGKMHTRQCEDLASLYPHWQDFMKVRAEADPHGVMLNPYLRTLFGISDELNEQTRGYDDAVG